MTHRAARVFVLILGKLTLCVLTLYVLTLCGVAAAQTRPAYGPPLPAGTTVHRDLAYGPHERNVLDLYVPQSDKPVPLVIFIHGGAWMGGDKQNGVVALPLLRDGLAVASINYRFSQQATFPAQIQDCKAAVRWLRSRSGEYHLDPDRFAAWGVSAGAHLSLMLGSARNVAEFGDAAGGVSSDVQAVVDWFGPTDMLTIVAQSPVGSAIEHDAPHSPVPRLIGGPISQNPAAAKAASPIAYVSGDEPPTLIVHGDNDRLVPWQQGRDMAERLRSVGADVEVHILPGAGHGDGFREAGAHRMTRQFLMDQLLSGR